MKHLKMISFVSISVLVPIFSWAAPSSKSSILTADQILKEVEKNLDAKDESAKIVMTITEANGASKSREIEILRKSGATSKVMVKLQSPPDLRGTALLSVGAKGKPEEQWLYMPSSKQSRRIASSSSSSNFLDSEMSYEDMGAANEKKYSNKILRTETGAKGPVIIIESTLLSGPSSYGKMQTWVASETHLPLRIDYFDKKGVLFKTTEMSDYKKFKDSIWRAQEVVVKNVQNHRSTQLQLKNLAVNEGINDSLFTVNAMGTE